MKFIAHRGLWLRPEERNTVKAFRACFEAGLGTETDIRDRGGELVISHDVPRGDEMSLSEFLELATSFMRGSASSLAINVKADGLASLVVEALKPYPQLECFFFDMSVPDMRAYLQLGLRTYGRVSEVESEPPWRSRLAGYWLDAFASDWYDAGYLRGLLDEGKAVAIVSPELHGRDPEPLWRMLREFRDHEMLTLCTDDPAAARTALSRGV